MYKKAELKAYKWKNYPNKEQFDEIKSPIIGAMFVKTIAQQYPDMLLTIEGMLFNQFPCTLFKTTFCDKGMEKDYYESKVIDIWEKLDQYLVINLDITDIQ
jgi:hypothetical protein